MDTVTPITLLASWIARQAAPDAAAWLEAQRTMLRADPAAGAFSATFSLAARRVGKAPLRFGEEDRAMAHRAKPGWQPDGLTLDQAARLLLLLDMTGTIDAFAPRLKALVATADLGELIAIYRGLPLYPQPDTLLPLATEGLRTSIPAIFEAVAHRSPFPAEHLPEGAWNQMVLKALFIGSALWPIAGLDARWNPALARILVDYARERRAAGRPISPELWRGVGRFADGDMIAELAIALAAENAASARAVALALADSDDPRAARALAARLDLAAAIADGDMRWDDVTAVD